MHAPHKQQPAFRMQPQNVAVARERTLNKAITQEIPIRLHGVREREEKKESDQFEN